MFNYFVNGEGESYRYARQTYEPFITSSDEKLWYDRINDRVGFVVTRSLETTLEKKTVHATLHNRFGSGTRSQNGAGHFRAVYASETGRYKAFVPVHGAVLIVTDQTADRIQVQTSVSIPNANFSYERYATTTPEGNVAIQVPYPGTYTAGNETVAVSPAAVETGQIATDRANRALWRLNDQQGQFAFDDEGGNHGRIIAASWSGGRSGSALSFSSRGQGVRVPSPDTLESSEAMTVSAWFRTNQTTDFRSEDGIQYPRIVSKAERGSYSGTDGYLIGMTKGNLIGVVGDRSNTTRLFGPSVDDGEWHHAVLTVDGNTVRLYLDGRLVGREQYSGSIDNDQPFVIGSTPTLRRTFHGTIDHVRYEPTAVNKTIVQQRYDRMIDESMS
jgi:hypothetical protein